MSEHNQLVAQFLKESNSPFASLDPDRTLWLASRLKPLTLPTGSTIVRQGKPAEEVVCYLLRAGSAEVFMSHEDGEGEHSQGTLEPGAVLGEMPMLTEEPHTATVRALEPCELLVIERADLLEVMRADPGVTTRIRELISLRHLPHQTPGILAHQGTTPEGEKIITLKDPQKGTYFRLSEGGFFIWQLLDGHHTIRDLMIEYLKEFGSFAPETIMELVEGLVREGFVEGPKLTEEAYEIIYRPTRLQRAMSLARRILEARAIVRGVDAPITRLYEGGLRILYTTVGQLILALVALAGLIAFALGIGGLGAALEETPIGGWLLLFWIPATALAILIHEAGHAFTTKHYGREVPAVGVGWYWFGPIAYVDTTDMWLEGRRWPRIAVSLAGPYADLVLGGIGAIVAFFIPDPVVAAFLWLFVLSSYTSVLVNLNPLMEFDGYYILIDILERPNLRPGALSWLGSDLIPTLRTSPQRLREHKLELLYGAGSVLYIAATAVLTVIIYRLTLEGWLAGILPEGVASGLAWVLAAVVVILVSAGVMGELHGTRAPAMATRQR